MCGGDILSTTMTSTNCNGTGEPPLPRTKYLKHTLQLTLEDMFNGTTRKLGVNKNIVCDECNGSGSASDIVEDYDTCEECNGLGFRTIIRRSSNDMEEEIERDCELCWGKGEAVIFEDRCYNCSGRKTVPAQSILTVRVKRGSRHGQKIIYKGEGTQEPNMRPGDVVVILEEIPHETFKRKGDDLVMTIALDLVESLCGFEKVVTTLDKRKLTIRSPQGKVIQTDNVKYLPGQGMPKYRKPLERGRLIIRFEVNLPSSIRARHVPSLEQCLPPRQQVVIPMDAVECNLVDMAPAEETYNDQNHAGFDQNHDGYDQNHASYEQNHAGYEQNDEEYTQDQNYDQQYDENGHYDQENGMHQYGPDEQYDQQNQYYADDNSYDVHGNYEHASEYDQHYNQQGYDSHNNFHREEFYQQEDDSLESYDATKTYHRLDD